MRRPELVGDLGLIFKDIGAPTVMALITFDYILGCFKEGGWIGPCGGSVSVMTVQSYVTIDAVIALLAVIFYFGDEEKAADIVHNVRNDFFMDS